MYRMMHYDLHCKKIVLKRTFEYMNRHERFMLYIVVVAVKKRKSNCNLNEKEVIKIVAEYKRSKYTCSY
jgi:hypothetical protein